MFVAGIDAHATYRVVAIVGKTGELAQKPTRIVNTQSERLLELLGRFKPLEVVVQNSPPGLGCTTSSAGSAASCSPTPNVPRADRLYDEHLAEIADDAAREE